ncbi:MAG: GNAT family N-acetyltransferase [Bacteroidetes bacterium]|nr:GNAT family N-acetyltransferase [Bacteroidota bacterium]
MLDAAIRIAREKGFKKIILETISPLKIAIAMYKNAGFKEIKPIVNNKRVDQAFELTYKS